MIDPGIFKKYDIRGRAGEVVTEAAAKAIGRRSARICSNRASVRRLSGAITGIVPRAGPGGERRWRAPV